MTDLPLVKDPTRLLLVNLGTPDAPEKRAVRRYLREFLMDERVLDVGPFLRFFLVHAIIAPFRGPKSAEAYEAIWTEEGSPLLVEGKRLLEAVQTRFVELGQSEVSVDLAMRYGNPSLPAALNRARNDGIDRVVLFPLYPQYSAATVASTLEHFFQAAKVGWDLPSLQVVPPFYAEPEFIAAEAAVGRRSLADFAPDHVVMSFHGLPKRQLRRSRISPDVCQASESCCDDIVPENARCYRAQCFATARALGRALDLPEEGCTVSFQSRLGRDPWIGPYTDETILALAKAGKKRVAVFCPAFVADCLETLEEIGMQARADFKRAGGEELLLIPSLNAEPEWADAVVALAKKASPWL
jgi:ferrochelatase